MVHGLIKHSYYGHIYFSCQTVDFFGLLTALFIWRNSRALVWLFWWLLWNRKAVSGECVSPHARRVYKCLITNFSPATMDALLVKIYTGNNQLISTGLCVVLTHSSTIRIFLLLKTGQYFRVSMTLRLMWQILVTYFYNLHSFLFC